MSIRTIRINLIFRVFLSLYRQQFTGQYIMNPSKRKSRRRNRSRKSIEKKSNEEQKSEHSSDQSDCYSSIVFSKQKRIKLMKRICYNLMMLWFPTWEYESSRLISKSLRSLMLTNFYSDSDETEEVSVDDVNYIDYDKVPITQKLKVITWENN